MTTIHAKSPCCNVTIYRFGNRRRQCKLCKKTWSIKKKKRGRKAIRVHPSVKKIALASHETLRHKATRMHVGREILRRRHEKNISLLLNKLSPQQLPKGKLIVIVDGKWFQWKKKRWTLYLALLRQVHSRIAVPLDPLLLPGHESSPGWRRFFSLVPPNIKRRICALVSDGITGMEVIAREHNWKIQRCHFHLLSTLQKLRGQKIKNTPQAALREQLYQLVYQYLQVKNKSHANEVLQAIHTLLQHPKLPKWYGRRMRGFIKNAHLFRTYRYYPRLNIPTTTNSIESTFNILSETVKQTRGFRTPGSCARWMTVQVRSMKPVQCNGRNYQQN